MSPASGVVCEGVVMKLSMVPGFRKSFLSGARVHILVLSLIALLIFLDPRGTAIGNGAQSLFPSPIDVAVSGDGMIYVVDDFDHNIVLLDKEGKFIKKWGGGAHSWNPEYGQLWGEVKIDFAPDGRLFVLSQSRITRVYIYTQQGEISGYWDIDVQPGGAKDISVAPDGSVYIAGIFEVMHFSADGKLIGRWGKKGGEPGNFANVWAVEVGPDGSVYTTEWHLADLLIHRVQKFTADGRFITTWGEAGKYIYEKDQWTGNFGGPYGIAIGDDGIVYVCDAEKNNIQQFASDGKPIRSWGNRGNGYGQFKWPYALCIGPEGDIYVADKGNSRVQVFSPEGEFIRQIVGGQGEM
jgi:tripartite motif-containing protein 71